jgi:hypothetical protein
MAPQTQKGVFRRLSRFSVHLYGDIKSENVGGLVSMVGSCLFLLGGDANGVAVSLSFIVAELILARSGHTRVGYSLGCALFSFGDALAVNSAVAQGNWAFQTTLAVMAVAWMVGVARAPLAWFGEHSGKPRLVAAADALQPIAGLATLVLRIPGVVSAGAGANYSGAAAIVCWAVADILVGRLQDIVGQLAGIRKILP